MSPGKRERLLIYCNESPRLVNEEDHDNGTMDHGAIRMHLGIVALQVWQPDPICSHATISRTTPLTVQTGYLQLSGGPRAVRRSHFELDTVLWLYP
ncbi:MAG: hypothetical protein JWP44_4427 [Mucilaginibacter sp.]|jgi:hypothetical protein|nr:hypothetical protein [Mucilaginibacter sp.]